MNLGFIADVNGIAFYISEFLQEGFGIFYFRFIGTADKYRCAFLEKFTRNRKSDSGR